MWELALHGSGATALRIVDGVGSAGRAFLGVRAGLRASFIAVDELDLGIFVDRDLDVGDGRLLLWDAATARD